MNVTDVHFINLSDHCHAQVRCSVWNKTSLIDLSPLIHLTGYYTATDEDTGENANEDKDTSRVFYINICQPLNPIPGVKCPPGAAVCMDPPKGDPVVGLFRYI